MARKFYGYKNELSNWGDTIIESTVCKIDFINKEYGEKLKSVFYCKSKQVENGRMCVYWQGRCTIELNDEVSLKGRYSNDIFLVSSYQIKQRK